MTNEIKLNRTYVLIGLAAIGLILTTGVLSLGGYFAISYILDKRREAAAKADYESTRAQLAALELDREKERAERNAAHEAEQQARLDQSKKELEKLRQAERDGRQEQLVQELRDVTRNLDKTLAQGDRPAVLKNSEWREVIRKAIAKAEQIANAIERQGEPGPFKEELDAQLVALRQTCRKGRELLGDVKP